MTTPKALRICAILGLAIAGTASCSGLGNDYEPGINNPGYTPGHGRPSYASALAASPGSIRQSPADANGAPSPAHGLDSGTG